MTATATSIAASPCHFSDAEVMQPTMCSLCAHFAGPLKINPPAPKMPQRGSLAVEQTSELTNRGTVSLSRG